MSQWTDEQVGDAIARHAGQRNLEAGIASTLDAMTRALLTLEADLDERAVYIAAMEARIKALEQERERFVIAAAGTIAEKTTAELERDAARRELEALREHLTVVLPMALGYARAHPVGRNQEMCDNATAALRP